MRNPLVYDIFLFIFIFLAFVGCSATTQVNNRISESGELAAFDEDEKPDEYYEDMYLRFEDHNYRPYIKSVRLHKKGWELAPPQMKLGIPEEGVVLKFDDLEGDVKDYYYTVVHCNANWEPSDLLDSEYLEGYFQDQILDYQFSFNTLQPFTHYKLELPNEQMNITKTGNYVLVVYLDNDPEQLVLTRRFMVYENRISIQPTVKRATILDDRNARQEVDFTINHGTFPIPNPYGDLQVVVTQNHRWDNAITGLKPLFVKDKELIYDYDEDNVFDGGNEFRFFDLKSMKYQSERIFDITKDTATYNVQLLDDASRQWSNYYSNPDINGKFLIKTTEGFSTELEAEYAYVHFKLPFEQSLMEGNVYVFGAMSDWQFKPEFQMIYNADKRVYEADILLKQGYYNYNYVFLKDNAEYGDLTFFEGNHFETENDYTIYVYYRDITNNYDRLIGVHNFNSRRY